MLTHKGTKRIQTSRLILCPLTEADAEAMYLWCSDEHVTKYMTYPTYTDIETLKIWLRTVPYHSGYPFGFVRKSDGTLIGSGDIGEHSEDGFWEFGYNFRYDCWGKGYATEAAKAMIAYAMSISAQENSERLTQWKTKLRDTLWKNAA